MKINDGLLIVDAIQRVIMTMIIIIGAREYDKDDNYDDDDTFSGSDDDFDCKHIMMNLVV